MSACLPGAHRLLFTQGSAAFPRSFSVTASRILLSSVHVAGVSLLQHHRKTWGGDPACLGNSARNA